MRKVLVSIAALGAALAAAPSMAQAWGTGYGNGQPSYGQPNYGQPGYGGDYRGQGNITPWQVRDMVERAIQRGEVSRGEARDLRDDVRDLFRLEQRTRYGNDWRARERLQRKTSDVLRSLRDAQRDGYRNGGRDGRDGYGGRDGWNR